MSLVLRTRKLLITGCLTALSFVATSCSDEGGTEPTTTTTPAMSGSMNDGSMKPGDAMEPGDTLKPGDAMEPGDSMKPGDSMSPTTTAAK